jgi:hypothetical protein
MMLEARRLRRSINYALIDAKNTYPKQPCNQERVKVGGLQLFENAVFKKVFILHLSRATKLAYLPPSMIDVAYAISPFMSMK